MCRTYGTSIHLASFYAGLKASASLYLGPKGPISNHFVL
jgi:hypothetical protein